jgi:hypothetical protein
MPVLASHIFAVPSDEAVTTKVLSELKEMERRLESALRIGQVIV